MTEFYTEEQAIAAVGRLTRTQLVAFVEAEIVVPVQSPEGPVFRAMDLARLELLCDLAEQYRWETEALGVVMSLVDQLHGVRAELRTVLEVVGTLPEEEREEILTRLMQERATR